MVIKQTVSALIFLPHNINISSSNNLIVWISEKLSEISLQTSNAKEQEASKTISKDLISTTNTFPIFNKKAQTDRIKLVSIFAVQQNL